MNCAVRFLLIIVAVLKLGTGACQQGVIDTLTSRFDNYRITHAQEKLYVHCDRSLYMTGETLWFKIYCTDGTLHQLRDVSKIAYVEITDQNNVSVLRGKISLNNGVGSGSFFLPASLLTGNYTFRAYSRWMRNNNPEFFFRKVITIINPFRPLNDGSTNTKASGYTVNFFPEGGTLIDSVKTKIAFSVRDINGKGVDCRLSVVDEKNDTLTSCRTARFGLGYFICTTHPGSNLRAIITDKNGKTSTHEIPKASFYGFSLQVRDSADYLRMVVTNKSAESKTQWVSLFVHARQIITHAEAKRIDSDGVVFSIPKRMLADGISHITLFDEAFKPVAERLYFKYPENKLDLKVRAEGNQYAPRSKINLKVISSRGEKNMPAHLSVSVYKSDSLNVTPRAGIFEYLWLSSDLTGNIESPEYYFSDDTDKQSSIDLVMLTHGWRRFRWYDVLKGHQLVRFTPEYFGHLVSGKVTNADGAPVSDAKTYLSFPDKIIRTYADISDGSGNVKFELPEMIGPRQLVAQASHFRGPVHVSIENPFAENHIPYKIPPVRFEPGMKKAVGERSLFMQMQDIYHEGLRNRFVAPRVDSSAFYGKPQQTFNLDDYTRFPVMEEVLREYVPGVRVRKSNDKFNFVIVDNTTNNILGGEPLILLDGIPISRADDIMQFDPRKVKTLEVVTKQFFLGPIAQNGIVSFSTYDGNLAGFTLDPQALVIDYEGLQLQREFYFPDYTSAKERYGKMPDFRNLLAWFPAVETDENGETDLDFYTSDLKGDYIVVVEGISKEGCVGTGFGSFKVSDQR